MAWTTALLAPDPTKTPSLEYEIHVSLKFFVGKSLHLAAYAGMTILGGWILLPFRFRLWLLFFLMAHAGITEHLQDLGGHRSGLLMDVLIDFGGVAVGLLLSWHWWTREYGKQ